MCACTALVQRNKGHVVKEYTITCIMCKFSRHVNFVNASDNRISQSPVWACRFQECLHLCTRGQYLEDSDINEWFASLLALLRIIIGSLEESSICICSCICRYQVCKTAAVWLTSVTAVLQRELEARNSKNPYVVAVKKMVKLLARRPEEREWSRVTW